ncbi:UNVERIFIED_CONTAM: hypothetical protein PYX00_005322 [Menopon gallinae]|uniref:Synaptic plasticity regulator PANTS n=1 Tax=Menopon gallinae TaxID=328185 RepID=A0AAW2HRJ4_9NEOP
MEESKSETSENKFDSSVEDHSTDYVSKYFWMIRPCEEYEDERAECKLIRSRFHQYFVHGEVTDCNVWARDATNCKKCLDERDNRACLALIGSESIRRLKRLEGHRNNDVWERRSAPPENWDRPLPEYWHQKNKHSLLLLNHNKIIEHIEENEPRLSTSLCSIL